LPQKRGKPLKVQLSGNFSGEIYGRLADLRYAGSFAFALPLFWAFWQNGLTAAWRLPVILPAFWQITGLLEVMIAAILALLLPWPIMILNLFVNLMRRRLDESRARAKSDALPGLHL
jgi:hypothetical protein